MANPEHLALLQQGVEAWNKWRQANLGIEKPDLHGANLSGTDLRVADLRETDLHGANLSRTDLRWADLRGSDLRVADLSAANLDEANLSGANLLMANFSMANLGWVDLSGANLSMANLLMADLLMADLHRTILQNTIFSGVNLTGVRGLDTCHHERPSHLDFRTLQQSGPLPLAFLRGCGLPDPLIDYLPSLLNQPIQFYSCFISYSSKDEDFAQRLHADLQNEGVRCWFAPEDIQGGQKLHEQIGEAIQLHDKLLLVLSEHSMYSEWVETEIVKARQREVREKRQVLFPIRLVDFETIQQRECFDADTEKDLAREVRKYFIPDFSNWKSHEAYQQAFDRLLRDLKPALEHKPETT